MRIYIIPVHPDCQPARQRYRYPKYNDDYGVEQDFLLFLRRHPNLITGDARQAKWHYLPVYWTRYHLNRNYCQEKLIFLQQEVSGCILDEDRTFTVCQFDDGPIIDLGRTTLCLSSRKRPSVKGIDIPLLASPIQFQTQFNLARKYLAAFQGQYKNHAIRYCLKQILVGREDVWYEDGDKGIELFVETLLNSWIGLCPRGYGGSSFRLYEVMQLGRVPMIIGDVDPRPFRSFFDWDAFSFYLSEPHFINAALKAASERDLQHMGKNARIASRKLGYQRWCHYLLKELFN